MATAAANDGHRILKGTRPSCTTDDGVAFRCTLAQPSQVLDADPAKDTVVVPPAIADGASGIVTACRITDAAGTRMTCYAGKRVLEEGLVTPGAYIRAERP